MKNKIYSILLLFAFVAVMLRPIVPFVQFYFFSQQTIVKTQEDCDCACSEEDSHQAKVASNGDAYLKALIKRVCEDEKKQSPKAPTVNITVYVKTLITDYEAVYHLPEDNYNEISNFIIQPDVSSYTMELFRPPQFV